MSNEQEMRAVMLHAAEKLAAVKDTRVRCSDNHTLPISYHVPVEVHAAVAYAEAILRLLASYLKIEETGQQPNGHKPGRIGPGERPLEKVERNAAVVAARAAGEPRKDVAARFGVTERRIDQIVAAHEARLTKEATP